MSFGAFSLEPHQGSTQHLDGRAPCSQRFVNDSFLFSTTKWQLTTVTVSWMECRARLLKTPGEPKITLLKCLWRVVRRVISMEKLPRWATNHSPVRYTHQKMSFWAGVYLCCCCFFFFCQAGQVLSKSYQPDCKLTSLVIHHSNLTQNSYQPGRLVSLKSYKPKAKFNSRGLAAGYCVQFCY